MTLSKKPGLMDPESPPLGPFFESIGERDYRAAQIRSWLFRKRARSFAEMTDLPQSLRSELERHYQLFSCAVDEGRESTDQTRKLLIRLSDGEVIEAVLIIEGDRATACISTQVGCPVGCPFCASGLDGTRRNLRADEIVEQVLLLDRQLDPSHQITQLVLMGIGEPLLNFDNTVSALTTLNAEAGFGMGARRMTLSTVGPRGKIARLERLAIPVNLAISLHAPDDALRDRLVPGNCGVKTLIRSAESYQRTTGRQVTFEYVLLKGVNSEARHATTLGRLLEGIPCTVNLIPFNTVEDTGFQSTDLSQTRAFRNIVSGYGVNVTVRKRKGRSIDAACGQLRLNRVRDEG